VLISSSDTYTNINTSNPRIKQRFRQKFLQANAWRMLVFCVVYGVFQAATLILSHAHIAFFSLSSDNNVLNVAGFEIPFQSNVGGWSLLQIIALCLAVVFTVFFTLVVLGSIKSPKTQSNLMHVCLVLLTCTQLILLLLGSDHNNFLFSFLVYILMLGILPVLPRAQSLSYIFVFAFLGGVCFIVGFPHRWITFPPEGVDLYIALLGLLASICASWLSYGLFMKNTALSLKLEDQKAERGADVEALTAEYKEKARVAEAANLAKTRFLTRVSHEMRTSLTTILGMVFVAKEAADPTSREESLDAIELASHKLRDIVGNIIDTTKIELDFAGDDLTQEFSLINADAAVPQLSSEQVEAPDLTGKNILMVEDLETNRFVLREYLKETHANVEEAVNGKEAVEMFSASPEGYYCFIFMDLLMPEMNGHDATRAIRKMERDDAVDIPIVAVSANAFKEDIETSLAAGMDAHLAKPVEQTTIFRELIERLV